MKRTRTKGSVTGGKCLGADLREAVRRDLVRLDEALVRLPREGSVPLLCCHGNLDPVVPHALGKSSADRLTELGWPVEWHDYMAPHGLHPDQIGDISRWLVNRLQ